MNLINKNLKAPKVSIFCMVYNHEPFIRECLEGFLMQKCNFDYEIVLGEDCSTDNSREIIIEYANKFPGKFKLLLHDKNIGAAQNQKIVFENCTGKYIAMCEGDDYWTDPLKLQKQFDVLESNPNYCMCVHRHIIKKNNRFRKIDLRKNKSKTELNISDILLGLNFHTSSYFFPSKYVNFLPAWYEKVNAGDQFLSFCMSKDGNGIYFIEDFMSVYNINKGSVTHNTNPQYSLNNFILHLEYFDKFTEYRYSQLINKRILIETLLRSVSFEKKKSRILLFFNNIFFIFKNLSLFPLSYYYKTFFKR